MRRIRLWSIGLTALLLCGCLEVQQHPRWVNGYYNGKPDYLPEHARFHNDPLAWAAAIANRNQLQNEYIRDHP